MTKNQEERLVIAFEQIAIALAGINDTGKKQYAKQWPQRTAPREAVYSRLASDEDRIREEHGGDQPANESLSEWLSGSEDVFGPREREFLQRNARAETAQDNRPGSGSAEAAEDQA